MEALHGAEGILYVSAANILEFSKISEEATTRAAEDLLEACLPRIFFVEGDPWKVIANEDQLARGEAILAPHADPELIGLLPGLAAKSLEPITLRGLLAAVSSHSRLQESMSRLGEQFVDRIESLRGDLALDDDFGRLIGGVPTGPGPQRATRTPIPGVLLSPILNQQVRLSTNDAMDFLHTVVPLAYADLLLLDRRWATLANQARHRLQKAGHSAPMAHAFSERGAGLEKFFQKLASTAEK